MTTVRWVSSGRRAAIRAVVNKSLAEGIVTEDLAAGRKAYRTSEVGDWLAAQVRTLDVVSSPTA